MVRWTRQIFKEDAARILRILIPHGERKEFAEEIGITPQALSRLLDPYDPRAPRLAHVWAIAAALQRRGIPPGVVREIAVDLILASPFRIPMAIRRGNIPEGLTPIELVEEVESVLLRPPVGWRYDEWLGRVEGVRQDLEEVAARLPSMDPWVPLLRAAQGALMAAAAGLANCLDRLEEALVWGKQARRLAWDLLQSEALRDPWLRRRLGERLYTLGRWVLGAASADCAAYYNLGRPEIAWRLLEETAKLRPEAFEATAPWALMFQAGLLGGRLAYQGAARGLSFRQVQALYGEGESLAARLPDPFSFHHHAGIVRYAGWALLRGETTSRHHRWIRRQLEPVIDQLARLDPLGQVLILRAWGELCWREGEREEAWGAIREAGRIAGEARLFNQLRKIQRDWRGRLSPQNETFPSGHEGFFLMRKGNFSTLGPAAPGGR